MGEADDILTTVWNDLMQEGLRSEAERARADPIKHKNSGVFENGNYRYFSAGTDGRGRAVRFCYTTHRNVAGFFLFFREVRGKKKIARDMVGSRRSRKAAKEVCWRRTVKFKEKRNGN